MSEQSPKPSIEAGLRIIAEAVKTLSLTPGVYRMIAGDGEVLYIGKAKALKKRVASYLNFAKQPIRLQRMIAQTQKMEFIATHTEAEALLLESSLIKSLQPRYNILLRDDKSFPFILIREDHEFAQVQKHRGAKNIKGSYFGPFAGAADVNRTLAILQRAFLLRNCSDSTFAQRERPCLQYHIKRCTAPCVGLVNREDYGEQVQGARDFLSGKSRQIQERMQTVMTEASAAMDYERAAAIRDRIRALTSVQVSQEFGDVGEAELDVLALHHEGGKSCVQVFFFRGGQSFGNRSYFPRHDSEEKPEDILAAFLAQFYQGKPVPKNVLVSHEIPRKGVIEEALAAQSGYKVSINLPLRGKRRKVIDFALGNAREALTRHLLSQAGQARMLAGVADLFGMAEPPERIEVYDNSHISGTNMVGAMIVAGPEGFQKNAYRRFNIKQADAADDYGMMREVLTRRFKRALKEQEENGRTSWPDLLLIDGGQGQYNVCREVLEECGVLGEVVLVAISKGPDRNAGREKFYIEGRTPFQLPVNDPVLHFLQRLRDEAHRFAIAGHRGKRQKQMVASPLDDVPGIGARRKKTLLMYFGSAKAVAAAGIEDLMKVEGISRAVAQKIYDHFHG
ncbi:MAG: excinuclease ABC subunit UvrC [Alphaproteobacteria bacterium]|nr:excinuclease ABC subunit UvrC [Alphaproteobacteria bacterium]QQS56773.1 MAG: excinuclease ABC subunit UvrC [Alphaproteobacteria bacterium]